MSASVCALETNPASKAEGARNTPRASAARCHRANRPVSAPFACANVRTGFYDLLERRTARLVAGIGDAARRHGVAATGGHAGSMWGVYLTAGPVRTVAQAKGADTGLFARWHRAALARGVFLAPSAFEAGFVSSAHTDADIDFTVTQLDAALGEARAR